jgi:PHP family Zn ribbon phosphoesterase
MIPLSELIAAVYKINTLYSKKVWDTYNKLTKEFKDEFNILLNVSFGDLKKIVDEKLAEVIIKNREDKITIKPGFDGVYGKLILNGEVPVEQKKQPSQRSLGDF